MASKLFYVDGQAVDLGKLYPNISNSVAFALWAQANGIPYRIVTCSKQTPDFIGWCEFDFEGREDLHLEMVPVAILFKHLDIQKSDLHNWRRPTAFEYMDLIGSHMTGGPVYSRENSTRTIIYGEWSDMQRAAQEWISA